MNTTNISEGVNTAQLEKKVVYTANVHTTGGRDGGKSRTSDGRLEVNFSVPGKPGSGTNPEQMLAAGWSSCFLSALGIVAAKMKVKLPGDPSVDAEVDLCTGSDGYSLQARFNVHLPGVERELAETIVDAAQRTCPYSKALRGSIGLVTNVV
jgi:Ohr subfamily peroxiredoxin